MDIYGVKKYKLEQVFLDMTKVSSVDMTYYYLFRWWYSIQKY